MKIYCAIKLNDREKDYLKKELGTTPVTFRDELPKEERKDHFLQSHVCFGNVKPEWLNETTSLKWIQLQSIGFGIYQNVQPVTDFSMTHLKNFFDIPVAETALAGIMALNRGIDQLVIDKEQIVWEGYALRPHLSLLQGKSVLILGGGGIGQQLKKLLSAFDAQVTFYGRRTVNSDIQKLEDLDEALTKTDIVINSLPGTDQTVNLFDKRRLSLLKSDAIFVNVGRGSAVDENALATLLLEKKIKGAVLDVTRIEPLPADHILYQCPNTLLTQHTAGGYKDEILDVVKVFLRNFAKFQKGEELEHIVNLKKGY